MIIFQFVETSILFCKYTYFFQIKAVKDTGRHTLLPRLTQWEHGWRRSHCIVSLAPFGHVGNFTFCLRRWHSLHEITGRLRRADPIDSIVQHYEKKVRRTKEWAKQRLEQADNACIRMLSVSNETTIPRSARMGWRGVRFWASLHGVEQNGSSTHFE